MHKALRQYLDQFVKLNDEEFRTMSSLCKSTRINKNEHLIKEGQYAKKLFFIHTGFVRYYQNVDGEETTRDFIFSPVMLTAYESWITFNPSDVSIQALTDCKMLVWNREGIMSLYNEYPSINKLGRILAEQAFINLNQHYRRLLKDDAMARYKDLLLKEPDILKLAPLQQIASFLNVTPQHLSRIRKSLSESE
jgi:CRP-like cAMP-binding protein